MREKKLNENWEILTSFFPKGWEEKAYEMNALKRKRKIESPEVLFRLLLIHFAEGKSLRTTAAYARESGLCDINDSALLHRLRESVEWLRWMSLSLLKEFEGLEKPIEYVEKHRVRVVDATMISEPGSTGSDWRLHYTMNLEDLHCDTFKVTDYGTGESFRNFPVQPDDLMVGDRVYCNPKSIMHVLDKGGNVLVRYHSTNLPLFNARGKRINVLTRLRKLGKKEIGDWDVYLSGKNEEKVKGRLCAIRKSHSAIERSKEKIRRNAIKKQKKVNPETYEFAEYIILFTTVNRHRLKKKDVMYLYRARWQIEIAFKRLKGILSLGHLHKVDPESCKAWLYGKMFVALLIERIHKEAESFSPWGYPMEHRLRQWEKHKAAARESMERV